MMAMARFMKCTGNQNPRGRDEFSVAKASLPDGLKVIDAVRFELMQLKSKKGKSSKLSASNNDLVGHKLQIACLWYIA